MAVPGGSSALMVTVTYGKSCSHCSEGRWVNEARSLGGRLASPGGLDLVPKGRCPSPGPRAQTGREAPLWLRGEGGWVWQGTRTPPPFLFRRGLKPPPAIIRFRAFFFCTLGQVSCPSASQWARCPVCAFPGGWGKPLALAMQIMCVGLLEARYPSRLVQSQRCIKQSN